MRTFECPKCGRMQEALAVDVSCPPLVGHPKGWGKHIKAVRMKQVRTPRTTNKDEDGPQRRVSLNAETLDA